MVTKEVAEAVGGLKSLVSTGTSVLIEGVLSETPEGTKQVGGSEPAMLCLCLESEPPGSGSGTNHHHAN